jgi:hypothetical protein
MEFTIPKTQWLTGQENAASHLDVRCLVLRESM